MGRVHVEQSKGRLFLTSFSFVLGWYRTSNKESLLHPDVTKLLNLSLTDPGESFGFQRCPPSGLVEIKGSPLACLEPDWGCLGLAIEDFGKNFGNCAITLFLFPLKITCLKLGHAAVCGWSAYTGALGLWVQVKGTLFLLSASTLRSLRSNLLRSAGNLLCLPWCPKRLCFSLGSCICS